VKLIHRGRGDLSLDEPVSRSRYAWTLEVVELPSIEALPFPLRVVADHDAISFGHSKVRWVSLKQPHLKKAFCQTGCLGGNSARRFSFPTTKHIDILIPPSGANAAATPWGWIMCTVVRTATLLRDRGVPAPGSGVRTESKAGKGAPWRRNGVQIRSREAFVFARRVWK
jgi:hypothetical protein